MCIYFMQMTRWVMHVGTLSGDAGDILAAMRNFFLASFVLSFLCLPLSVLGQEAPIISVSFPEIRSSKPLDGRLLLLLSNDPSEEPRMQIDDTSKSQMVFGVTVDGMGPGQSVTISDSAAGYPVRKLSEVPPGNYTVQAVLDVYETFHRADGSVVKLSPDRGEGKHWNLAPGNLYSKPRKAHVGPGGAAIAILLDQVIPPIVPEADTKYVRHIRIQSALLTKFWADRCS